MQGVVSEDIEQGCFQLRPGLELAYEKIDTAGKEKVLFRRKNRYLRKVGGERQIMFRFRGN